MMIYQEAFALFSQQSPVTVMMRGILENVFSAERLDRLYRRTAQRQYEEELLFSTVAELMALAVSKREPSVHAAYQHRREQMAVSIRAVYSKLQGIESPVCRALLRETAAPLGRLIATMSAGLPELLPGYAVKIVDGNHLRHTERRLKELRTLNAAPLPGQALVVLDPQRMLAVDVFPCADGHAQERSLLGAILPTVAEGELWIADRNFCTVAFLSGLAQCPAYFAIRQHAQLPLQGEGTPQRIGRGATGVVFEQQATVTPAAGGRLAVRRITVHLDRPTRDGDTEVSVLSNLPAEVPADTIAQLYLQRWTIEGAFAEIATTLRGELDTLAYPQAALFGFCMALLMYNVLSTIKAAIRAAHAVGNDRLSAYYLAEEIAATYRGMMIVLPPPAWRERFAQLSIPELAAELLYLAKQVPLARFRKHPRGPKKPPSQPFNKKNRGHVSTKRILDQRAASS